MELALEKFDFFKRRFKRSSTTEIIGGILIAASIVVGFLHRQEIRQNTSISNVSNSTDIHLKKLADKQIHNELVQSYQTRLDKIEFNTNPEKIKRDIWREFKVPVHFVYIVENKAELTFTHNNYHVTVLLGKKENIVESVEKI